MVLCALSFRDVSGDYGNALGPPIGTFNHRRAESYGDLLSRFRNANGFMLDCFSLGEFDSTQLGTILLPNRVQAADIAADYFVSLISVEVFGRSVPGCDDP